MLLSLSGQFVERSKVHCGMLGRGSSLQGSVSLACRQALSQKQQNKVASDSPDLACKYSATITCRAELPMSTGRESTGCFSRRKEKEAN